MAMKGGMTDEKSLGLCMVDIVFKCGFYNHGYIFEKVNRLFHGRVSCCGDLYFDDGDSLFDSNGVFI